MYKAPHSRLYLQKSPDANSDFLNMHHLILYSSIPVHVLYYLYIYEGLPYQNPTPPPVVDVAAVRSKVNPTSRIVLRGGVDSSALSPAPGSTRRSLWRTTSASLDMANDALFATSRTDQLDLVILPNVLLPGSTYTFTLAAWFDQPQGSAGSGTGAATEPASLEGFGSVTLQVNVPPSGGSITVSTSDTTINGAGCDAGVACGYSVLTDWAARVSTDFVDSPEDLPLSYAYSYSWCAQPGCAAEIAAAAAAATASGGGGGIPEGQNRLGDVQSSKETTFVLPTPPAALATVTPAAGSADSAGLTPTAIVLVDAYDALDAKGSAQTAIVVQKKQPAAASTTSGAAGGSTGSTASQGVAVDVTASVSEVSAQKERVEAALTDQRGGQALLLIDALVSQLNDDSETIASVIDTSSSTTASAAGSGGAQGGSTAGGTNGDTTQQAEARALVPKRSGSKAMTSMPNS